MEEISRKKYRAPLNDVQCASERDACLQCYRDKQSDILQCKEVADAFIRCSQQTTEVSFVLYDLYMVLHYDNKELTWCCVV